MGGGGGSAASEWGTEMAYDINAALSPFDALGAISSGQQAMQGFQTLRNNAQTMRSRAAMARALQGDRNAMADIQDPEMLAKLQEHFRQQGIREGIKGFYNTLDQDRIGVNNLATLASAKPKGFDLAGATQYALSQGAFEEAKPLLELAKLSAPEVAKWIGNPYEAIDAGGNPALIGMTTAGPQPIPGYTPRSEKPMVSSGRIVRYGPGNDPIVENLPMTPAEQAAASTAQRRADLEEQRVENERLRALQTPGMTPYQEWIVAESAKRERQSMAKEYKSLDIMDATLAAYKKELSSATRGEMINPWSEKGQRLASLATQMQMAYKTAAELGAITGPDWAIINRIISTPTSALSAAKGPQAFLNQLDEVARLSKRDRALIDKKYGASDQEQPAKPARNPAKAANWLKSRNIKTQSQFNDAVIELKKRGWTDDEIRAASEGM